LFRSARALKNVFKKNPSPQEKKMVVALNTLGRFELFPSPGTVVVFRFVLLDSGLSIPNEFGGLRHVRVNK
jgi:hypothetical protein